MENINLVLSQEDTRKVILTLLIKAVASQRAALETIIELAAIDRKEADLFCNNFHKKAKFYSNQIFEELYADLTQVDLNQILKS